MSHEVEDCLLRAKFVSNWIAYRTDGLALPAERRRLLSAACVHQAMEHHDAIIRLVELRLYGSAVTMVRPIFEAYIRALWLFHCAKDSQIKRMGPRMSELDTSRMIPQLVRVESVGPGVLDGVLRDHVGAMNSFTHTNWLQMVRRITETSLEPNYEPSELTATLNFASSMALLSAGHVATLRSDDDLAADCLEQCKHFAEGRTLSGQWLRAA